MKYFWETTGSIKKGLGFSHWSPTHLLWLLACVLICLVACLLYRRCSRSGRRIWRFSVAALIVFNELLKTVILLVVGRYTKNYLPLHLCTVNIFLIALHALKPFRMLDNFLYAFCIPAAAMALAFPSWTKLPFANFMHWHSFTLHILLLLYPLMLTVGGEIKPHPRELPKALGLLLLLAIPAYAVNLLLGTNYMFLMKAPKGNPLYWFGQSWGNHLLGIPVILLPLLTALYLPWVLARRGLPARTTDS